MADIADMAQQLMDDTFERSIPGTLANHYTVIGLNRNGELEVAKLVGSPTDKVDLCDTYERWVAGHIEHDPMGHAKWAIVSSDGEMREILIKELGLKPRDVMPIRRRR